MHSEMPEINIHLFIFVTAFGKMKIIESGYCKYSVHKNFFSHHWKWTQIFIVLAMDPKRPKSLYFKLQHFIQPEYLGNFSVFATDMPHSLTKYMTDACRPVLLDRQTADSSIKHRSRANKICYINQILIY